MSNNYYTPTGNPATNSSGSSATIRAEFALLQNAFDKLPDLAGNGSLPVFVNTGGTALEAKSASAALTALGGENISNRNANNGYPGLSGFRIQFKNITGTYTSLLSNSNTAVRTYTFPDKDGTMVVASDLPHTIASHTDTSATGAQLNTLVSDAMADALHRHSELSASDGSPNPAASVDADGNLVLQSGAGINEFSTDGTLAGDSDAAVPTEKAVKTYVDAAMGGIDLTGMPPVGAIIAFIGGYFTDSTNGGFTDVIGNSVAAINSLVNGSGWYVCNGAACNHASSSIFNGGGRYLPRLTDDRFLQGDTAAGETGGSNSSAHTHTIGGQTLSVGQLAVHNHTANTGSVTMQTGSGNVIGDADFGYTGNAGSNQAHDHGGATGAASATENRPAFLSCFYLMRVY